MSLAIYNVNVVNIDDLTTPTSAKREAYRLGAIYSLADSDVPGVLNQYMYVKSHAALTQYQPYVVVPSQASSDGTYLTAAPSTQASGVTVCVPQVAFSSGYYGFVQISGVCTVNLSNVTHVPGDYLQLVAASPTVLIVDGTSGSTSFSPKSVAIQISTLVGAGSATIHLFGGLRDSLVSAS